MNQTVAKTAESWSKLGQNYANSEVHKHGISLLKLITLARPVSSDVCLDVGTGTGHTAAALAPYAKKVYGLDPSSGMREAAKKLYGSFANLEFVEGTSEATKFPDDTFDVITARHTLHHHPNMAKTLLELRRVLKSAGRLVIVDEITPNEAVNDWYHDLELSRDPTHVRAYYLREWQAFIKDSGLKWIVGDTETRYKLDAEAWIMRQNPTKTQAETVRGLFKNANETAKKTFDISYKDGSAVSFEMPMAVILVTK